MSKAIQYTTILLSDYTTTTQDINLFSDDLSTFNRVLHYTSMPFLSQQIHTTVILPT